jgi:hypothetical protein
MKNAGRLVLVLYFAAVLNGVTRAEEIICSEYCPVSYCVARGAPLKITVKGRETTYFEITEGIADQGEYNERYGFGRQKGGQWGGNPSFAMYLCGYIFLAGTPVVDVVPDAPKPGEALECRVVIKSDLLGAPDKLIDNYEFTWKKFEGTDEDFKKYKGEGGVWTESVPKGPRLAAGITKEGERWTCYAKPIGAEGKVLYTSVIAQDIVEIGRDMPGDGRVNTHFCDFYGQYRHVRGYFKVDISTLAGKKIRSARFRIFCEVQDPPFVVNAYACPNTWDDHTITWVNQPLKFPFTEKPIGSVLMDEGPLPTPENPAAQTDWFLSNARGGGEHRAPAWREIDVTEYARRVLASGEKALSLCLAGDPQQLKTSHSRAAIHNENKAPGYTLKRGDMRPRLAVETE